MHTRLVFFQWLCGEGHISEHNLQGSVQNESAMLPTFSQGLLLLHILSVSNTGYNALVYILFPNPTQTYFYSNALIITLWPVSLNLHFIMTTLHTVKSSQALGYLRTRLQKWLLSVLIFLIVISHSTKSLALELSKISLVCTR